MRISTNSSNEVKLCGGSIIGKNLILTAAHCFYINDLNNVEIKFNSTTPRTKGTKAANITNIFIHPQYNNNDTIIINDIAIIETEDNTNFDDTNIIPLTNLKIENGAKCNISGWGMTDFTNCTKNGAEHPIKLNFASIIVKECQKNNQTLICSSPVDDIDSCVGDSGGPLVCNNKLFGIISHSVSNKSYYTSVNEYNRETTILLQYYKEWTPLLDGSNNGYNKKIQTLTKILCIIFTLLVNFYM